MIWLIYIFLVCQNMVHASDSKAVQDCGDGISSNLGINFVEKVVIKEVMVSFAKNIGIMEVIFWYFINNNNLNLIHAKLFRPVITGRNNIRFFNKIE